MQLVLTDADLSKLKPATRADLLAKLFPVRETASSQNPKGYIWDDVVDMTPSQIENFMAGCADITIAGLKVFAEHGPEIHASLLAEASIENYANFQGSITKRTRTITGDKNSFLFTWDDWNSEANGGVGHYAVTDATYRSLRIYFQLD
ncbi:hypothetical protein [Mesorhizobium ciceri]|uniref:Uncharacterized protein n=1 Tax=Mesorhizobium ciceri biovar biserrulae (strain HAMBI 2942 / LMG 23838 / WSM1271) TaxID=765698 RepID=E8T8W7_MESCW|nr:hypothetical protein [Mesorhizobium ciceri]ADV13015.1 hypothetical protein Mesci_3899 [Mesorhizobium ciceri biovar biserrulae WSM1271]